MSRLQAAFLGLVAVSALVGAYTVVDFGDQLRTSDDVQRIKPQVSGEAVDAEFRGERLAITIRLSNPSRFDLELVSGAFRVYNETDAKIVAGNGVRTDDGGSVVPARGSLTATFEMRVTDAQRRMVAAALERDAMGSANLALALDDRAFQLSVTDLDLADGGE